jgi:hypothetical protein
MDACIANSFRNYHAKGVDYINLLRHDKLTIKLYFLNPDKIQTIGNTGYLVNPHNHRYAFGTHVLFGMVGNLNFVESISTINENIWNRFNYYADRQPNERFEYSHKTELLTSQYGQYQKGDSYYLTTDIIHTLVPFDTPACLLLHQYQDTEMDGTQFYSLESEAPKFSGEVYSKFTPEEVTNYLTILKDKIR